MTKHKIRKEKNKQDAVSPANTSTHAQQQPAEPPKAAEPSKPAKKEKPPKPPKPPKTTAANAKGKAYLDTFNSNPLCASDKASIEKKCVADEVTDDPKKAAKETKKTGAMQKIAKATNILDEFGRTTNNYKRKPSNAWMDTHCTGMWNKPQKLGTNDELKKRLDGFLSDLKSRQRAIVIESVKELGSVALEKAGVAAAKKIGALMARTIAKNAVGGAAMVATAGTIGTALEAAMLAWTIADVGKTAVELAALAGPEGIAILASVTEAIHLDTRIDMMKADYAKSPDKALADAMGLMSKFNRCLQAKRCQLVTMSQTNGKTAAASGNGCCPGQTGHHLLPNEMFRRKIRPKPPETKWSDDPTNCPAYTNSAHQAAPVVCVEGATNRLGTHGVIHDKMETLMENHRVSNPGNDYISTDAAIKAAVISHQQTFKPECNKDCLTAQLKSHYDTLCAGKLKPRGGLGSDVTIDADEGDTSQTDDE